MMMFPVSKIWLCTLDCQVWYNLILRLTGICFSCMDAEVMFLGPLFSASMIPLLSCNSLEINVCMSIVKSRSEA